MGKQVEGPRVPGSRVHGDWLTQPSPPVCEQLGGDPPGLFCPIQNQKGLTPNKRGSWNPAPYRQGTLSLALQVSQSPLPAQSQCPSVLTLLIWQRWGSSSLPPIQLVSSLDPAHLPHRQEPSSGRPPEP